MNSLFEFNNEQVIINPILLSIKEFETIWKRDKTKGKVKARKELTYIYAMCSKEDANIWKDYINLNERSNIIITDLWGDELKWSPDRTVNNAIKKYNERIPVSPTELLLQTLLSAMMKIKVHIDNIDYTILDNNGKPLYKPKDTLDLAKRALDQYMEIEEAMEKIKAKQNILSDQIKGGGQEGLFEDSDSITNFNFNG